MFEPRGHYDMYGALLVEPDLPGADLAVLFMHNEGYSTMCGHAIIALGRYAVDEGLVARQEPVTTVNIEAPCGLVVASVEVRDGKAGAVSFESVPAFLFARDQKIELPGFGPIGFDIAYGGAFYALADCRQFGLGIRPRPCARFRRCGHSADRETQGGIPAGASRPCRSRLSLRHHPDRRPGRVFRRGDQKHLRLRRCRGRPLADRLRRHRAAGGNACQGRDRIGQTRVFESIAGSRFSGAVARTAKAGRHDAIIARVGGRAYYSGRAEFIVEPDDDLGRGFLLR